MLNSNSQYVLERQQLWRDIDGDLGCCSLIYWNVSPSLGVTSQSVPIELSSPSTLFSNFSFRLPRLFLQHNYVQSVCHYHFVCIWKSTGFQVDHHRLPWNHVFFLDHGISSPIQHRCFCTQEALGFVVSLFRQAAT